MAQSLTRGISSTLVTVASTSTTGTSANFALPVVDSYTFYLVVATATAGTMDVVFQTSVDGGTTYVNIPWRFAQVATTTGSLFLNAATGLGPSGDITAPTGTGTLVADTGGALSLRCVIDEGHMKIKYTIATGPDAFILYLLSKPRGSSSGS